MKKVKIAFIVLLSIFFILNLLYALSPYKFFRFLYIHNEYGRSDFTIPGILVSIYLYGGILVSLCIPISLVNSIFAMTGLRRIFTAVNPDEGTSVGYLFCTLILFGILILFVVMPKYDTRSFDIPFFFWIRVSISLVSVIFLITGFGGAYTAKNIDKKLFIGYLSYTAVSFITLALSYVTFAEYIRGMFAG